MIDVTWSSVTKLKIFY